MTALISPAEAAERLGISEKTLRRHVEDGRLAVVDMGCGRTRRRYKIDPDDLARFVAGRKLTLETLLPCRSTRRPNRPTSTTAFASQVVDFTALRARSRGGLRKK